MTKSFRPFASLAAVGVLAVSGYAQVQAPSSSLIPAPAAPATAFYAQYNGNPPGTQPTVAAPGMMMVSGQAMPAVAVQAPAIPASAIQAPAAPAGPRLAPSIQPASFSSAVAQPTPFPALGNGGRADGVAYMATGGVSPAGCNDCSQLWAGACDATGTAGGSCFGSACASDCGVPCPEPCGLWAHYTSVYGSALYLRPRNAEVAYAVPINGPIINAPANNPLQIGGVGVIDPDYEVGFSGGVNLAVNAKTSLFAEVMMFDSTTDDQIQTAAPDVMRSMVSHPSSTSAATDFLSAAADLDIQFDTFDVGIRHLFVGGRVFAVNYLVGARYSRLEQSFGATFVDNGTETVATDIDFDGAGLRLGLELERQSCNNRLRIYSRGSTSFLAGRFRGNYFQGQSFDPTVVDTSWEAGRVVPVLDLELGAGWSTRDGRLRLNAGYLVNAWFNTVTTDDFIRSVQQNDFINLGDTLTFDGLRATAELRF